MFSKLKAVNWNLDQIKKLFFWINFSFNTEHKQYHLRFLSYPALWGSWKEMFEGKISEYVDFNFLLMEKPECWKKYTNETTKRLSRVY